MKKYVLIITFFSIISLTSFATTGNTDNFVCSTKYIQEQVDSQVANVAIEDVEISFEEEGQCTVSVSVEYNKIKATFSVTADTCEEAGAGAVEAAVGFIKKIKAIM